MIVVIKCYKRHPCKHFSPVLWDYNCAAVTHLLIVFFLFFLSQIAPCGQKGNTLNRLSHCYRLNKSTYFLTHFHMQSASDSKLWKGSRTAGVNHKDAEENAKSRQKRQRTLIVYDKTDDRTPILEAKILRLWYLSFCVCAPSLDSELPVAESQVKPGATMERNTCQKTVSNS